MPGRLTDLVTRLQRDKLPTLQTAAPRLSPDGLAGLVGEAVIAYSRVRPRRVRADIPGTGAFDLPLPDGTLYGAAPAWVLDFSTPLSLEEPIGERPPALLDADRWELYPAAAPTAIRLLDRTLAVGQTARLVYAVPHTINDVDPGTIPTVDDPILLNLAAWTVCTTLAAATAEAVTPLLAADSVNHRTIAQEWAARAKDFLALLPAEFQRRAGGGGASTPAAGAWLNWDLRDQLGLAPVWPRRR